VTEYTDPSWHDRGVSYDSEPKSRYDAMMIGFAKIVRGECENPWSYEYELRLYRILLAACGVDIDYKKEIVL
jgi:hypothetical protein